MRNYDRVHPRKPEGIFACFSTLPSTNSRAYASSPSTRSNLLTPQRISFES